MSSIFISFLLLISIINHGKSDQVSDLEKKLNQMKIELSQLNKKFESQININNKPFCEQGWISYSDTKCYKVLSKKGTELEAKVNCYQIDSTSTLITIESKQEQIFLSNHLKDYKNISDFVWIGLEYVEKSFKWVDGNGLKYENWGENAVKDGNNKCVQMSLADSELGKWTDDLCQRKYLFVCQTKQFTKTVLCQEVKKVTSLVGKLQQDSVNQQEQITKLSNKNQTVVPLIPIGFLYTQFPNQSSPHQLWPNMEWTEVTQQYAGLFFRAEGSGSELFGTIQQANQSWISNIKAEGYDAGNARWRTYGSYNNTMNSWTHIFPTHALDNIDIFQTGGEVRPKNTAIKIWKCIS